MDAAGVVQLLSTGGGLVVLAFVVVGFMRGWIVPGFIYDQIRRQNNDLLDATLRSNDAAALALDITKRRREDEARR